MARLASKGAACITLIDLGKNIYPFFRAARNLGINIQSIGDDRFAAAHRRYRGIPMVRVETALSGQADAVVVGNGSTVHGNATYRDIANRTTKRVHHWFGTGSEVDPERSPRNEQHNSQENNPEQAVVATA